MTYTRKGARKAPSFQMKDEHPSSVHRCQIPRYHVVTEVAEQRNHDPDVVRTLCRNLHPRVLRPSMTLTTRGQGGLSNE